MRNIDYARKIKETAGVYLQNMKQQYMAAQGYGPFDEVDEDLVKVWNESVRYLEQTFEDLEDWARGRDDFEEKVLDEFRKAKNREQVMIGMLEKIRQSSN